MKATNLIQDHGKVKSVFCHQSTPVSQKNLDVALNIAGVENFGNSAAQKTLEIPRRRRGLEEVPSMVGVWIFSGTTVHHRNSLVF